MSSQEFSLWIEYYNREPFGFEIEELRDGDMRHLLASVNSTKKVNRGNFSRTFKRTDIEKTRDIRKAFSAWGVK